MLCEIGARVSCEQRGNLWEIITQLHKRIRRCVLNLAGPYKLENTFSGKCVSSAPCFPWKSGVSTLHAYAKS